MCSLCSLGSPFPRGAFMHWHCCLCHFLVPAQGYCQKRETRKDLFAPFLYLFACQGPMLAPFTLGLMLVLPNLVKKKKNLFLFKLISSSMLWLYRDPEVSVMHNDKSCPHPPDPKKPNTSDKAQCSLEPSFLFKDANRCCVLHYIGMRFSVYFSSVCIHECTLNHPASSLSQNTQ